MMTDAPDIDPPAIEGPLAQDRQDAYVLQRRDDGRFLTPAYLRWSQAAQDAQRCDLDEAQAIQGWLATIGVRVTIGRPSSR
jgi:hypothetical protein